MAEFCQAMSLVRQAKSSPLTSSSTVGRALPSCCCCGMCLFVQWSTSSSGFPSGSTMVSSAGLALLSQDKQQFTAMFAGLDKAHSEYLSASEAQTVLVRSDLSRDKLRQIW